MNKKLLGSSLMIATVLMGGASVNAAGLGEAGTAGEALVMEEKPAYTEGLNGAGEALVMEEKPEFKGGISGDSVVMEEKPEYTLGLSGAGEALVMEEKPEFKGGIAGEPLVMEEKPAFTGLAGGAGEALVMEEKPEFKGGIAGESLVMEEKPAFTGDLTEEDVEETVTESKENSDAKMTKVATETKAALPKTGDAAVMASSSIGMVLSVLGLGFLTKRRFSSK